MYAIIRTGGHQEKVTVGEQITVDLMNKEPGEEVRFVPLMIAKDDGTIVTDHAELTDQGAVVGKVLQHIKADKLEVFNYRQKTGYRKHTGHRQKMTLVEIAELRFGDVVEKAEEKKAAAEAEKTARDLQRQAAAEEAKGAPKKVTPKKKSAAKTSAKAPAAKKSAAKPKKSAAKKSSSK
jgi:large subunit ribosomal protein L21